MIKYIFALIILSVTTNVIAQYSGPIPMISSGYGSNGALGVSQTNILNDHYPLKSISVFYPTGTTSPIPTVFYAHGFGGTDYNYGIEIINHIVSKGYAVVFVPYKSFGVTDTERYLTLFDGFNKSARNLTSIIDTSRVGFMGHSYGAGALPILSYREFTENNWGTNGKFLVLSAPWYSYELGSSVLSNYPTDCNMQVILYDNDSINDHRMGMDIFNNIAINDSIKDCITVYSDTVSGYIYQADHYLTAQYSSNSEFDALDYYVTFRLFDAIADFTFTGNPTAKEIALGNGSPSQIDMGTQLSPLSVTDTPVPTHLQSQYLFPCDTTINERQSYCQPIAGIQNINIQTANISLYPNPTNKSITILTETNFENISVTIYSSLGAKEIEISNQLKIDLSTLTEGVYYTLIEIDNKIITKKIIKIK